MKHSGNSPSLDACCVRAKLKPSSNETDQLSFWGGGFSPVAGLPFFPLAGAFVLGSPALLERFVEDLFELGKGESSGLMSALFPFLQGPHADSPGCCRLALGEIEAFPDRLEFS